MHAHISATPEACRQNPTITCPPLQALWHLDSVTVALHTTSRRHEHTLCASTQLGNIHANHALCSEVRVRPTTVEAKRTTTREPLSHVVHIDVAQTRINGVMTSHSSACADVERRR